jgi:drug/metabolite transporter (DMT)-like permease
MAYLAVGGSAVASMAYFASLKRLSATRVAAGQFLIPGVAVLVDIARGVSPTPIVALGMALTILGVALVNRPPRRRAAGGVRDRLVVSRRAASAAVEEGSSGDAPSRPCA